MSEVQHTVRDAINRLKAANSLGKTNLSDKGVDLPGEENTTYEVVDGIEDITGLRFTSNSSVSYTPSVSIVVQNTTMQIPSFSHSIEVKEEV